MENLFFAEFLTTKLFDQPFLQQLLDLLLKSSIILVITFALAKALRQKISNSSSHLLWLNGLLCIALLPFAGTLLGFFSNSLLDAGPITIINVLPGQKVAATTSAISANTVFATLYLLVVAVLLFRLMFSAISLKRLNDTSVVQSDTKLINQLSEISTNLGISRTISLKFSHKTNSPMSFGLLAPVVILPAHAASWSESTLEDVLVHELSHIKRLDWPTMLFCHLLSSVLWINPLLWMAKSRVDEAAEQACDSAVLSYGKDGVQYAEDLLRLAKASRLNSPEPILAQLMFDQSSLSLRIENILDGSLAGKVSRAFIGVLAMSAMLLISACSGVNLFGQDESDGEILPLVAIAPQYPTRAAQNGIEGWALVSFTVDENGSVPGDSITVVDAEPAEIFDRSSTRAAGKFKFEPRVVKGRAVPVEGVQYLFRYALEDGYHIPVEGQRQPPIARNSNDL